MTLIAIHAVIDIIWIALMCRIGLRLAVAICALEDRIVGGIGVAGRANTISAAVGYRPPGMVERCAGPRRGVVARCASCRENGWRGFMNRIRGRVVVCLVASVAGRWKCGVVIVDVAGGAGDLRVEPG